MDEQHVAVVYFTDTTDEGTAYDPGTLFPREGVEVSPERFEQLRTANNAQRRPVIAKLKKLDPKPSPEEQLDAKTKDDLKALADEKGIEYDSKATKADLVELLKKA